MFFSIPIRRLKQIVEEPLRLAPPQKTPWTWSDTQVPGVHAALACWITGKV